MGNQFLYSYNGTTFYGTPQTDTQTDGILRQSFTYSPAVKNLTNIYVK